MTGKCITISALLALTLVPGAFNCQSSAASILYEAVDLGDVVAGRDVWQYNYFVRDFSFEKDQGFTISFDGDLYEELQTPPAVIPGWDILVLQPDPLLPADGAYDALAVVDNPSLAEIFRVSFVFEGAGRPGSQPFTINQFNAQGNFVRALESGITQLIPEPSSWWLTMTALAGLALRVIRRR